MADIGREHGVRVPGHLDAGALAELVLQPVGLLQDRVIGADGDEPALGLGQRDPGVGGAEGGWGEPDDVCRDLRQVSGATGVTREPGQVFIELIHTRPLLR